MCRTYDLYNDLVSLSIQEQRGLLFIGAITAQDAVDTIDSLIIDVIFRVSDQHLQRATNLQSRKTKPPRAPQSILAATRLFKALKKTKPTIIKSASEALDPSESTRQRYQALWYDQNEPSDAMSPPVGEALQSDHLQHINTFLRKYNSSRSAGGDGIHSVTLKALLNSTFPVHLAGLFKLICSEGTSRGPRADSLEYFNYNAD